MRIRNVSSFSKYFSYASKSGKTIEAGAQSIELPFETLHNKTLWVDIDVGNVKLILSDQDRAFMARIMAADAKTVSAAAPAAAPKARKQLAKERRERFVKTYESQQKLAAQGVKINAGGPSGQPQFGSDSIIEAPKRGSAIPNVITGKPASLEDIKRHNQAVRQIKRANPPPGVPMNPPGLQPGQPAFSQGVGPGNEDQGVGRKGPDTMANAASLLGGLRT